MQAQLPNAELAFLSACHSAAGDLSNTPDEVIHLASGMQFCGFRSVVGTLWAMVDLDGPDISNEFYKYMFQSGGGDIRNAAAALNHATREMRKRKIPMDRWINFVHIGI
jgi:CHAT domain-containing protein